MVLINMARKCLWARHILRFIYKIIQSLPTNGEGGVKNDVSPLWIPNMHQGPIDAEDWRPHLSQRCCNCIVGSLLGSHSSLPHPPPFSCADNARLNEAVWRGGNYRLLSLSPGAIVEEVGRGEVVGEDASPLRASLRPAVLRWMAGRLSCCQRQLESASWIRGLLFEWLLEMKWCITAYGDVSGLTDELVTIPSALKNAAALPCTLKEIRQLVWSFSLGNIQIYKRSPDFTHQDQLTYHFKFYWTWKNSFLLWQTWTV